LIDLKAKLIPFSLKHSASAYYKIIIADIFNYYSINI